LNYLFKHGNMKISLWPKGMHVVHKN